MHYVHFVPIGFLTAILQNYARQNNVAVDSLTFTHKVLPYIEEQGCRGVTGKENILNKAFKVRNKIVLKCGLQPHILDPEVFKSTIH